MRGAFLISELEGQGVRRIRVGNSITVGRAMDCGFVIDDAAASRHHVTIKESGDGYAWEDLGSTNGTMLNGRQVGNGNLADGDKIQIGETVLLFQIEEIDETKDREQDTTIFKETLLDWRPEGTELPTGPRSEDLLRAVYKVVSEIASNYEPCSLVDRILQTTMRAIDAQRGAVLFAMVGEDELSPCQVCGKYHVIEEGHLRHVGKRDIRISRTVAHRVLSKGESLLFQDTDSDSELRLSESVMSLKLRSIICVPLRGKFGILGLLYIDSSRENQQYSHEDMLLTTAVGNSAGLALENAQMHTQIIEKERTDQEIEHAWRIQEGFLVKDWPNDDKRFEVYGETRPAKVVGGDFYDFVNPHPDRVGILIGDVSGKGVPAALSMAQLIAEFRLYARHAQSPLDVIKGLNEGMVRRSQQGMFCTLCYITFDLLTGRVCCCNAGHHPPLLIGENESHTFADASGPPLGVLDDGAWSDSEITLRPGDTVLLYTDGIVEARGAGTRSGDDDAPDEFGAEKLNASASAMKNRSPYELIRQLNKEVVEFCAPVSPHDDCTMVALKYTG